MITLLGVRQQQLLTLLLQNKEGLTVEDLSKGLSITDNAVRQHLTALERDGLVVKGETKSTGGRPEQLFGLTAAGHELFPRHYSWFANCSLVRCARSRAPKHCANGLRAWVRLWGGRSRPRSLGLRIGPSAFGP